MTTNSEYPNDEFQYQGKKKSSYRSSAVICLCSFIALIITLIIMIIENLLSK